MYDSSYRRFTLGDNGHIGAIDALSSKIDKYAILLVDLSIDLNNESLYGLAAEMLGVSKIIKHKVAANKELNEKEKLYLYELLDNR